MRVLSGYEHPVRSVAYSPDGQRLAGGDEADLLLWSLPEAELAGSCITAPRESIEALAFSPDGKRIATAGPNLIRVWDVDSATEELLVTVPGHEQGTRALAWSPDGRGLVSAGWDKTLRFWTPAITPAREPIPTPEPMLTLAVHPSGAEIVAGGSQRSLVFWFYDEQLKTWHQRPIIDLAHPIFALALSRDGQRLAVGLANGEIQVWDFARRERISSLTGHEWVLYGLAFTPDGTRLVSGGADGTVRLWDVPHRRLIETYRWHKGWVTCVAVSPDGMTAAAGSNDRTIVVWDLADV